MRLGQRGRPRRDWLALAAIVLLLVVGLLNLRNADHYSDDSYHYNQIVWILVGAVAAILVAHIDLAIFERLSWLIYGITVLLLVLVILVGREVNYSKRWLEIGGFTMQPSELAKLAVILVLARFFQNARQSERFTLRRLWRPFLVLMVPAALIMAEPDLGTTLTVLFVGFSVILFAGLRLKSLLLLFGNILLIVPIAWQTDLIRGYQKDRVTLWLHPEKFKWDKDKKEKMDLSLQPEQALWAVGSGQFWGKGSRQGSRSRLRYLPEMQTDFIIATYSEENGFFGCTLLLALYYFVVHWILRVARDARDRFSALVAVGVAAIITWQAFFNIGMVTGLLPVVGLTLPLMSYGGSSTVVVLVSLGLVFNVSRNMTRH